MAPIQYDARSSRDRARSFPAFDWMSAATSCSSLPPTNGMPQSRFHLSVLAAPVPDFAKKFLGATNVVTQTDAWDLEKRTGRLEAEIKGVPVRVAADMKLADEGAGAANSLKWSLDCGIPFVGGKLEQLVASDIQSKAKGDLAQSREILKSY